MPGGLPGKNFILLEFGGEADIEMVDPTAAGAKEGVPAANNAPVLDEDEEEDEELEEVGIFVLTVANRCCSSVLNRVQIAPLPIRVLRSLVDRFWGRYNVEEEGSSEDGSHEAEMAWTK